MNFSDSNIYLLVYFLLWFSYLYIYKRINGRFTLGYIIIALYTVLSIFSIRAFNSDYAFQYYERDVTLLPLIYLFGMIFITSLPITTLKENKIKYITIPGEPYNTYLCGFFGLFSVLAVLQMLPQLQEGFNTLLLDSDAITDLYYESTEARMSKRFSSGFSIIGVISNLSGLLGPLLFYTYLLQKRRNKFVLILVSTTIVQGIFIGISTASRAKIISSIFSVTLLYFFFKPYLEDSIKKTLKKVFLIGSVIIVLLLSVITLARVVTNNKTVSIYVERYLGEGNLVFDNYCMSANGTRDGYYTAPLFLRLLGNKTLTETEKRMKFQHLGVDNSRFYTYVGDYVLDYGPYVAFVIFVLIAVFGGLGLRYNNGLSYGQVVLLYMLFKFCSAYYQAAFTGTGGNIEFLFELSLSFIYYSKRDGVVRIYRK